MGVVSVGSRTCTPPRRRRNARNTATTTRPASANTRPPLTSTQYREANSPVRGRRAPRQRVSLLSPGCRVSPSRHTATTGGSRRWWWRPAWGSSGGPAGAPHYKGVHQAGSPSRPPEGPLSPPTPLSPAKALKSLCRTSMPEPPPSPPPPWREQRSPVAAAATTTPPPPPQDEENTTNTRALDRNPWKTVNDFSRLSLENDGFFFSTI